MASFMDITRQQHLLDVEDDPFCPISHIYGDFFAQRTLFSLHNQPWNPPTDIYEIPGTMIIKMELAGVKKEEIEIILDHNVLTIQGHRAEDNPFPKKNYYLMEIHFGYFFRSFNLSHEWDRDNIQANYKDGFLTITIHKKSSGSDEIPIDTGGES